MSSLVIRVVVDKDVGVSVDEVEPAVKKERGSVNLGRIRAGSASLRSPDFSPSPAYFQR